MSYVATRYGRERKKECRSSRVRINNKKATNKQKTKMCDKKGEFSLRKRRRWEREKKRESRGEEREQNRVEC